MRAGQPSRSEKFAKLNSSPLSEPQLWPQTLPRIGGAVDPPIWSVNGGHGRRDGLRRRFRTPQGRDGHRGARGGDDVVVGPESRWHGPRHQRGCPDQEIEEGLRRCGRDLAHQGRARPGRVRDQGADAGEGSRALDALGSAHRHLRGALLSMVRWGQDQRRVQRGRSARPRRPRRRLRADHAARGGRPEGGRRRREAQHHPPRAPRRRRRRREGPPRPARRQAQRSRPLPHAHGRPTLRVHARVPAPRRDLQRHGRGQRRGHAHRTSFRSQARARHRLRRPGCPRGPTGELREKDPSRARDRRR